MKLNDEFFPVFEGEGVMVLLNSLNALKSSMGIQNAIPIHGIWIKHNYITLTFSSVFKEKTTNAVKQAAWDEG